MTKGEIASATKTASAYSNRRLSHRAIGRTARVDINLPNQMLRKFNNIARTDRISGMLSGPDPNADGLSLLSFLHVLGPARVAPLQICSTSADPAWPFIYWRRLCQSRFSHLLRKRNREEPAETVL